MWFGRSCKLKPLCQRQATGLITEPQDDTHCSPVLTRNHSYLSLSLSLSLARARALLLEDRLRSSFCQRWCNHLDTSERLSVYNSYKHCFQRERYVAVLWMEVYRHFLAQFRMGVSQINLHRHRFSTTTGNTACPFCANQQETEIHFAFQCPVYNQLRSKYLPDIINVRDPQKTSHHPHEQYFSGDNSECYKIPCVCI